MDAIKHFTIMHEAVKARQLLRANGIYTFIKGTSGDYNLMGNDQEAIRARVILALVPKQPEPKVAA